jgi:hypothetical protein
MARGLLCRARPGQVSPPWNRDASEHQHQRHDVQQRHHHRPRAKSQQVDVAGNGAVNGLVRANRTTDGIASTGALPAIPGAPARTIAKPRHFKPNGPRNGGPIGSALPAIYPFSLTSADSKLR